MDRLIHTIIHPFGKALRAAHPRAYETLRWYIAHGPWMRPIMGSPMYHELLLPFVVRTGDTVFDIGANTGQHALPLARLVGEGGTVHAFEPISANFSELRRNILQEGLAERIVLNQLALGEATQAIDFTIPLERLTEASSVPHHAVDWHDYGSDPGKYTVETSPMTTLDQYVRDRGIDRISFIKCDVEGAEFSVMKGAEQLLRGAAPPAIMLEVFEGWTRDFGYRPADLFRFLHGVAGYEFYWICEDGLKRVAPDAETIPGIYHQWLDYLCLIPGVHGRRVNLKRYLV